MPGPKPQILTLTDAQHTVLTELTRRHSTPQRIALRARLILAISVPHRVTTVSRDLAITDKTLHHWRQVWLAAADALRVAETDSDPKRLATVIRATLTDDARPGTPALFSAEQIAQIMAIACEAPPEGTSHWTQPEIARTAIQRGIVPAISARSVGRFLKRSQP